MSKFYEGAARIDRWMQRPKVDRFMEAFSLWYMALLGVLGVGALLALAVAGVVSLVA